MTSCVHVRAIFFSFFPLFPPFFFLSFFSAAARDSANPRLLRYAVVNPETTARLGLDLVPENGKRICQLGEMIKVAAREQVPVNHPEFHYPGPDIIVIRAPPAAGSTAHSRNAVVMSNCELDWDRCAVRVCI